MTNRVPDDSEPEEVNAYKTAENEMRKALADALESGASVTVAHNGTGVTATIAYQSRTRMGHGNNAATALASALAAQPTR